MIYVQKYICEAAGGPLRGKNSGYNKNGLLDWQTQMEMRKEPYGFSQQRFLWKYSQRLDHRRECSSGGIPVLVSLQTDFKVAFIIPD
jgi:hypothetical protein